MGVLISETLQVVLCEQCTKSFPFLGKSLLMIGLKKHEVSI